MASLVNELSSLDFSQLIGGPMQAAIAAQTSTALAQIDFIQQVGIDDAGNLREVSFNFTRNETSAGGDSESITSKVTVPALSIVNMPSLRIDEMTIDFNAKLTSVETKNVEENKNGSVNGSAKIGSFVNLKASASYQKKTTSGSEVNTSYNMAVHVHVVSDEIPSGMSRILSILESQARIEPVSSSSTNGDTEHTEVEQ